MKSPQPGSAKRFYKVAGSAEHSDGFGVQLDGRPIKTPAGSLLVVPTRALADAIAAEWNAQGEVIVPASLPLTKLANTAIDGVSGRQAEVANDILQYAATDLLCYRASHPAPLAARQAQAWDPILNWISAEYDAQFLTGTGVAHVTQPDASLGALRGVIMELDAFTLTALHVKTSLTGSALIALAHAGGYLSAVAAWDAANIDENWQISQWGEDFEAAQRQKSRFAEFEAASRFYALS
ncbi:MAG: ATPase [Rhodomicrobium sp.]|nr:ATPase [Rhodomicrobium sp.]